MASEYIKRIGSGKYQVVFKTDEKRHYLAVQNICREIIDHKKPDEPIQLVRCRDCKRWDKSTIEHEKDDFGSYDTALCEMFDKMDSWGDISHAMKRTSSDWFCADGEKEEGDDDAE